ncbi:sugar-binding domain-containing protein [Sunxiuqinia sp. A32]|uniref:sugar-binding domain-containing protein n=1 Tax=Sunxiuqinia sp. A32 TaxID=3461496 RepID=UPI004046730B
MITQISKRILFNLLLLMLLQMSVFAQDWQLKQAPLMTSFSEDVDPNNVLPEYPRPQLVREEWMNLNGLWQFQPGLGLLEPVPQGDLARSILVPFAVESAISGVMEHHSRLWYKRTFTIPENWNGKNIIIHFGAVDYESEVYINGTSLGIHYGGYDPFSYDITDYLNAYGEQDIIVRVYDPTDAGGFPRGKQTLYPGGIMYTSVTGIWQSVWLEPVSETHIENIKMIPDIDESSLTLTVNAPGGDNSVSYTAKVKDGESIVQTITGNINEETTIPISNQKLWSPDSPFLYNLEITLNQNEEQLDSIGSYFGMRKIDVQVEDGIKKLFLNNEFLFQMGPLDQGYWPDGLYTAPTDEALRYDIDMMKNFGYNMVRKHIKVEPYRWYYWADKLGLMVWQDMPSANSYTNNPQPLDQVAYEREMTKMIEQHWNSPSIVMWVVFNEAQGQHRTPELVTKVKTLDPNRPVNQASGWEHFGVGDILDIHSYPAPACPKSTYQVLACGEFGGVGYKIPGHLWNDGFGYVMANNEEEYLNYYEDFMDQLTIYKSNKGMSAAVYTEITDVEVEVNGLMTYDRIVKADIDRIREANQKVIKKDIFVTELVPSSENQEHIWKYTTNTPSTDWYQSNFDDSNWNAGNAGFGTVGTPGGIIRTIWNTSDIWLRREFELGDLSSTNKDNLVLSIHHDEDCEVYFNGVLAATATGWTTGYTTMSITTAAKNALKSNDTNVISIHCKQTDGGQYIDAGISYLSGDGIPTDISQFNKKSKTENYLYPLPANDQIQFAMPFENNVKASIIDSNGNNVKQLKGRLNSIDISELLPGMYVLRVISGTEIQNFRFIKIKS